MVFKNKKVNLFLVVGWLLIFNWNNGFGLNVEWWVYCLLILFWIIYFKLNKLYFIVLPAIFILNLYINHLYKFGSFDWERMNLTNPTNLHLIEKYRFDDLQMPYFLRIKFYQPWLNIFLWIDSSLKILSPLFWTRILGFSGLIVGIFGITKIKFKYWLWFLTVILSSGLGILVDTKTALVLALPIIIMFLYFGIDSKTFKKYWWMLLIVLIFDLVQK